MTYSQKYAIVHFIEPVPEGTVFTSDTWPPHTTIADVFAIDLTTMFLDALSKFIQSIPTVQTTIGNRAVLGSAEEPVYVRLLKENESLHALHNDVIDFLEKYAVQFNTPEYTRDGFLPHITMQLDTEITQNQALSIDSLSLIDMFPDDDWRKRKVISTFNLK